MGRHRAAGHSVHRLLRRGGQQLHSRGHQEDVRCCGGPVFPPRLQVRPDLHPQRQAGHRQEPAPQPDGQGVVQRQHHQLRRQGGPGEPAGCLDRRAGRNDGFQQERIRGGQAVPEPDGGQIPGRLWPENGAVPPQVRVLRYLQQLRFSPRCHRQPPILAHRLQLRAAHTGRAR